MQDGLPLRRDHHGMAVQEEEGHQRDDSPQDRADQAGQGRVSFSNLKNLNKIKIKKCKKILEKTVLFFKKLFIKIPLKISLVIQNKIIIFLNEKKN